MLALTSVCVLALTSIYMLALTTLKMATRVAEKVSCHYIIKLHSYNQSAFVGLFNKFYTSNGRNMERIKLTIRNL